VFVAEAKMPVEETVEKGDPQEGLLEDRALGGVDLPTRLAAASPAPSPTGRSKTGSGR
jgi:hypothetical protein